MLRKESHLIEELGEPSSRNRVDDEESEVWRWPCLCLAVRLLGEDFQWLPCERHRPSDWEGWQPDR